MYNLAADKSDLFRQVLLTYVFDHDYGGAPKPPGAGQNRSKVGTLPGPEQRSTGDEVR